MYTRVVSKIPMEFRYRLEASQGREGYEMDVTKILAELKAEREQIEEAIVSLERLAGPRARAADGRRPGWREVTAPKRRGRPPGSKNKVSSQPRPNAACSRPVSRTRQRAGRPSE